MRPAASRSIGRAVGWMGGAIVALLTMALSGRELSRELSIFEIVFVRNTLCLAGVVAILAFAGFDHVRTARIGRHVARNVVHFAAQFLWFFALTAIPIAEVFAIEFTVPIWTALLAAMFLGERLTGLRLAMIGLGFTGVLVILRPGLAVVHPAALMVLGAALGYAGAFVITKDLVATDRPLTIVFWMNAIQLPLGLVPSVTAWVTPSPVLWPWVAALGIAGLASHYCISRALVHGDVTVVVPLDFLRLPLAAVVAWFVYAEPLDPFVFVGAALIFYGNWLNVRRG